MSNDENSNESVSAVEGEEAVEAAAETVVEESQATADEGNAVSKVLELKESNPKVFFGAVGALVLVILFMFIGGGSDNPLPAAKQVNLVVGNSYTLKGINSYGDNVTIRLVAVPGSIAAYDESEKDGNDGECKDIPQGTQVKLLQVQEAFGGAKFVQLEVLGSTPCAGKKGWASANNLN